MTLVFLFCFAAAGALALALRAVVDGNPLLARVAALREAASGVSREPDGRGILADQEPGFAGRALSALAGRDLDPASPSLSKVRRRLMRAGHRAPAAVRVYLGSRVALAIALPALLFHGVLGQDLEAVRLVLLLCVAATVGLVLPSFLLDRRIASRQLQIEQGLPDALDLMVVCIEAGLGLTASIARVASEYARSNPPLSEEFELVTLESHAGRSNVQALRGLAERTGLAEVSALSAMLIQTERFGTSVATALRVHAESMRVRRMQRAEENAAKAPIKMIFPAALFIFPATLLVIAGPGVIRLMATLQGG